ncbi:MAG TPA: exodeoxyribonuclease III [Acidimicrobiales bacterium]|nr:exodeoxyribonuclease III [Acidimicrobiales bacterium]
MRIATWNVNSLKARLERVEAWIAYAAPDVVCLQETKMADAAFPTMAFDALGYESAHHGEGRWNGVAILSRVGMHDVVAGFCAGVEDPLVESRIVSATCGGVRVSSVYVPNGRAVGTEHYEAKLAWLRALRGHVAASCEPSDDVVVCGDFNIAPDDRDVWNPKLAHGGTHVSEPERDELRALLEWGMVDAFRTQHPEEGLFSWWDYRAGDFHKHHGMRIDLVLVSHPLAELVTFALIDRNARKGKAPSDHAPLVVDIDLDRRRSS